MRGRNKVWGSLNFEELKEKIQKKGMKRKRSESENVAEKKDQGNSFCLVA